MSSKRRHHTVVSPRNTPATLRPTTELIIVTRMTVVVMVVAIDTSHGHISQGFFGTG